MEGGKWVKDWVVMGDEKDGEGWGDGVEEWKKGKVGWVNVG